MKEINLYEINEFNKSIKDFNNLINNEDNEKILKYSGTKKEELENELKEIQIKEIQNNGMLDATDWLKKSFLEQEIEKHNKKITEIENIKESKSKELLQKELEKEDIKRQLNLMKTEAEIELADMQKKWDEASKNLRDNQEKIKGIINNNREFTENSIEYQNNMNEILKLQEDNKKQQKSMKENVITLENGLKVKNRLDDIKAMIRLIESGNVLENIKNPEETKVELKTEPKVELKVEPKVESKVEPNVETKVEQKVEVRKPFQQQKLQVKAPVQPLKAEPQISSLQSEIKWHPKLTKEQIEELIEQGLEPGDNEYDQYLWEHAINPFKDKEKKKNDLIEEKIEPLQEQKHSENKEDWEINVTDDNEEQINIPVINLGEEKKDIFSGQKIIDYIYINPFLNKFCCKYEVLEEKKEYKISNTKLDYSKENYKRSSDIIKSLYIENDDKEMVEELCKKADPNIVVCLNQNSDLDTLLQYVFTVKDPEKIKLPFTLKYDLKDIDRIDLLKTERNNIDIITKNIKPAIGEKNVLKDSWLTSFMNKIKYKFNHNKALPSGENKVDNKEQINSATYNTTFYKTYKFDAKDRDVIKNVENIENKEKVNIKDNDEKIV